MEASPKQQSPGEVRIGFGDRMLMAQPDTVLCKLAARGNANAYEVLFERYRQPVFAFVFHLLGRSDGTQDCEDIVQDSFAKAFAGIRDKRVEGSFRAWIYTIARNRTFDLIRARKSNVHSLDADTTEQPSAAEHTETERHAEQRLELAWLVGAVAELPERQRDALLLRELGGMSHTQIATQLGTTVSATKKLIGRGREAVTTAAANDGYRSRDLGRELAMAAPIVPLAAVSIGFGMAGGAAFASGGAVGGAAFGGKAAATVMAVVALGGGAAVVEHERSSTSSGGDDIALMNAGAAASNAVTSEGTGSGGGRSRGELPIFGVVDDRRGRGEDNSGRGNDDAEADDRRRGRGRGSDDGPGDDRRPRPDRELADDSRSGSNKGKGGSGSGGGSREPRPDRVDDGSGGGSGGHGGGDSGGDLPDGGDDDGGSNSGSGSSGSGSGGGSGDD